MASVAHTPLHTGLRAGWRIFRHELLFIFWALMEVALITPVFLAMTPWTTFWSPAATTLLLLLVMLIPFNLSRLTSVLGISVQRQQIIMVFGLLLVILVSWRILIYAPAGLFDLGWLSGVASHFGDSVDPRWPRELALFLVVAFLWWRGIALAGRGVDYRDVGLRMRAGVLLALFFVAGLAGSQLEWSVTPFILLFLFVSLVSVVLTRVEQLELSRSGRSFPIGPSWLITIMVAAALVALATGVIAGITSGESIGAVVGWFEPLWVALRFVLASIVSMISLLISPLLIALIAIVEWFVGLFGDPVSLGLDGLQEALQNIAQVAPTEEAAESGELVSRDYRQLLTVLSMIFVVLLVSLALGRLYRMARPAAELGRQSVSPFEGVDRLQRPGLVRRIRDSVNALRRRRAAASIRHTYRAMCAAAAEKGYPRAMNETAYEYLPTLAEAWPGLHEDTELITEAYIRVHYGEIPESDEELRHILAAWKRLSSADSNANASR